MEEPELRVLIVDDDPDVRERLQNILTRRGYRVSVASNGLQGLEMARKNHVDVIFCDIVMPDMDGLELLNKVREYAIRAEVVMVTGFPSVEWLTEAIEKNAVEFMAKPLTTEDVLKSLNKAKMRLREKNEMLKVGLEKLRLNHIL